MIRGDYHSTIVRHVLDAVEFNFPEQAAQNPNDWPEYFQSPLREYRPAKRSPRLFSLGWKCTVRAQAMDLKLILSPWPKVSLWLIFTTEAQRHTERKTILQRPFPIDELYVNSWNSISSCAARAHRRVYGNAVQRARQPNKTPQRNL